MKLPLKKLALLLMYLSIPFLYGISSISHAVGVIEKISPTYGPYSIELTSPNNYSFINFDHVEISGDGRYVLYASKYDVIPEDINGQADLYLYDRQTHKTEVVSVADDGSQQNGSMGPENTINASISADGRFVVFRSRASNLVSGDTNNAADVFLRDRQVKRTFRVNVASDGSQSNGPDAFDGRPFAKSQFISADGRFVAFYSDGSNLVPGDTNNEYDIFLHDMETGQTSRINVGPNGEQVIHNHAPLLTGISADGHYVFFDSSGYSLVNPDGSEVCSTCSYVYDRITQQNSRVDVIANRGSIPDYSHLYTFSADGRYAVFQAWDAATRQYQVYVRDLQTQQTTMLGGFFLNIFERANISIDGRYIYIGTLVIDQLNNQVTSLYADINSTGAFVDSLTFSADGRYVAFKKVTNEAVAGFSVTRNESVFVLDRLLDSTQQANIKVTVTTKPATLVAKSTGAYTYTITNASAKPQSVNLLHLVSKGVATGFKPGQGSCKRYATTSLCKLGTVQAGRSVVLKANVKVNSNQLRQKVVVSAAPIDPQPINNSVNVITPVK